MAASPKKPKAKSAEIEIFPMAGVALLIVLIMMMFAKDMFMPKTAKNIQLPQARTKEQKLEQGVLTLGIDKDGNFYLYDKMYKNKDEFWSAVEEEYKRLKDEYIKEGHGEDEVLCMIRADKNSTYGEVMDILSTLKKYYVTSRGDTLRMGLKRITIAIKPQKVEKK